MAQAQFLYEGARDAAGVAARVTVFGLNRRKGSAILDDLGKAGFRAVDGGQLEHLLDGPVTALGDVVIVECPDLGARDMAAFARLDERIARSGTQLIVATGMEGLDAVFSLLDQSQPQILVDPSRAEIVVAVGRLMGRISHGRVREMDEQDRVSLLRLSEQVDAIAQELDRISALKGGSSEPAGSVSDFKHSFTPTTAPLSLAEQASEARAKSGTLKLPDAKLVRAMIAARQARGRFFDANLFADPAWDMLLDLTAAHAENARVSVTSLCIAACVPATTALRWLKQMVETGVFVRVADPEDGRRAFIELSESSQQAMARYFESVENPIAYAA
ncbi:MAG: MarR family transcriptional regulator [Pseudomonadota bacterium]